MSSLNIISRESLSEINGLAVNGVWHDAGRVMDFRSDSTMSHYLPKNVSLSWVSLKDLNPLEPHFHPIDSYVAILENEACFIDQKKSNLKVGQVVQIPSQSLHSFASIDSRTFFWGLAWNRTSGHLFKDNQGERLVFFKDEHVESSNEKSEIIDVLRTESDGSFFESSPLHLRGYIIQSQAKMSFKADGQSWLITPQLGFVEQSTQTVFKAGDFVSNITQDLEVKNVSDHPLYIFKLHT